MSTIAVRDRRRLLRSVPRRALRGPADHRGLHARNSWRCMRISMRNSIPDFYLEGPGRVFRRAAGQHHRGRCGNEDRRNKRSTIRRAAWERITRRMGTRSQKVQWAFLKSNLSGGDPRSCSNKRGRATPAMLGQRHSAFGSSQGACWRVPAAPAVQRRARASGPAGTILAVVLAADSDRGVARRSPIGSRPTPSPGIGPRPSGSGTSTTFGTTSASSMRCCGPSSWLSSASRSSSCWRSARAPVPRRMAVEEDRRQRDYPADDDHPGRRRQRLLHAVQRARPD